MYRAALLAMDFQLAHLTRMPADYLPRAERALDTARAFDIPVIHVTLRLLPGHVDAHPRNKIFGSLPPHAFTADDPGAAIHPAVAPLNGEISAADGYRSIVRPAWRRSRCATSTGCFIAH
jgi:nicotinamidase-related amidase